MKKRQIECFREEESRPGSSDEHERILRETLLAVGRLHFVRAWRNEVGVALRISDHTPIKYGLVGSADILGILAPDGKLIGLEVKSGNATLRDTQKNFRRMMEKFGGLYFVVRNADEAVEFLTANYKGGMKCKK